MAWAGLFPPAYGHAWEGSSLENLLELLTILSFIVAFGALAWATMGMMAATDINPDPVAQADRAAGATRALFIAIGAIATYIVVRLLRKRMD